MRRCTLSSRPGYLRREDPKTQLLELTLPRGRRNTMLYRWDGLRTKLHDSEGDKRMVWDSEGGSGYQDLLDERMP